MHEWYRSVYGLRYFTYSRFGNEQMEFWTNAQNVDVYTKFTVREVIKKHSHIHNNTRFDNAHFKPHTLLILNGGLQTDDGVRIGGGGHGGGKRILNALLVVDLHH